MSLGQIHSTQKSQSNLLELLDFCRGFAIFLVFWVHYKGGFGWQGVHVFIVLSGFGLTYACLKRGNRLSWKDWYYKRLRRILPVYGLTCFLGYLVMAGIQTFEGSSLLTAFWAQKQGFLLDLTLLKNFHHATVVTIPNFSLWFVPFIVSFYLAFPWLYQFLVKPKSKRTVLLHLYILVALELIYRAVAIHWLDGSPIGYRNFEDRFPIIGLPLDRISNQSLFIFQGEAIFGFFPARIGEFALGMVAAIAFIRNGKVFQRLVLSPEAALAGLFVWIVGNQLLYAGFVGWVVADLVIAFGMTLFCVNLAVLFHQKLPIAFEKVSQLGVWSFYIFLTHFLFVYLFILYWPKQAESWIALMRSQVWSNFLLEAGVLGAILLGTWLTCQLLKKFDQTRWPDWMMQQTIARILK